MKKLDTDVLAAAGSVFAWRRAECGEIGEMSARLEHVPPICSPWMVLG
jgi:hypothetical protein